MKCGGAHMMRLCDVRLTAHAAFLLLIANIRGLAP